ncbi:MAG: CYTH domain-containing protein [Alphaproteobacteria bacterium]|nr:CYTH domain-containing protein [Alphaproteobacteria bacterium]MDE2337576.1 CYTH domain-containing protein [Alphaproteobacteria bacterium]
MAKETERKFLVTSDGWRAGAKGVSYVQGYIPTKGAATVRVRIAGDKGFITVKGGTQGISRDEYEYEIPKQDAQKMLDTLCGEKVEKTRYRIPHGGLVWEVDEFAGANRGLIVAEVELPDENSPVDLPPWAGAEVSRDPRYANAALAKKPYSQWTSQDDKKCQMPKP